MNPSEIILIRFPQTDLRSGKLRPALVIATAPGRYNDLLLALITSNDYQAVPEFDEIIDPSDSDYSSSGLKVRSVVRLARLASVESSVINARLGDISDQRLRNVKTRLADWLQK